MMNVYDKKLKALAEAGSCQYEDSRATECHRNRKGKREHAKALRRLQKKEKKLGIKKPILF